jgi:adenylate cyclase, class 2
MADNGQEIEAKFYVRDLKRIQMILQDVHARLIQERVLETNIRFDRPDLSLRVERRVLRLRRDTEARLTYKGPGKNNQGILSRREIEFVVEDFEKAKQFLEALGYQKLVYYEKYRATYGWDETLIMLDELPYGSFVEIEGKSTESIRGIADQLHLNWDTAIATGYHALFERAHNALDFPFRDISFANFAGITVDAVDLDVEAADE